MGCGECKESEKVWKCEDVEVQNRPILSSNKTLIQSFIHSLIQSSKLIDELPTDS
jgi:hypothetical protein